VEAPYPLSTSHRLALGFAAATVAVAAPWSWAAGNHEFVLYVAVLVVLGALVLLVHRRVGLHPACVWGLALWGTLHMLGGLWVVGEDVGVLYNLWLVPGRLKYDQAVHAYGFGLCTWLCWQAVRGRLADPRPTAGVLVLCALGGMGLGAFNEVVEFAAVLAVPETNVGGYENTAWDLVFNGAGATLAAVAIGLAHRRRAAARR
jgi:hypothetical protein